MESKNAFEPNLGPLRTSLLAWDFFLFVYLFIFNVGYIKEKLKSQTRG